MIHCNEENHGFFEKVVVWEAGKTNVEEHRLPGMNVSNQEPVKTFAEARVDCGDCTPNHIVMKRSVDGGITWSENVFIEKSDGKFWSEYQHDLDHQYEDNKKEVWANPTPLVNAETGRIFVLYTLNEGNVKGQNVQRFSRLFYKYSDDGGVHWSDRVDITDVMNVKEDGTTNKDDEGNWISDINGIPSDYLGRAFYLPGPGHGIQLTSGRLLLQVWSRTALGKLDEGIIAPSERKYGVRTIYSDDGSDTWKAGASFGHNGMNMSECGILESDNGDV